MAQISMGEWDRLMSAGQTTYAIGPVLTPAAVFANRAEAERAASLLDGKFIQWDGPQGHQLTAAGYEGEPWMEPEAEI